MRKASRLRKLSVFAGVKLACREAATMHASDRGQWVLASRPVGEGERQTLAGEH